MPVEISSQPENVMSPCGWLLPPQFQLSKTWCNDYRNSNNSTGNCTATSLGRKCSLIKILLAGMTLLKLLKLSTEFLSSSPGHCATDFNTSVSWYPREGETFSRRLSLYSTSYLIQRLTLLMNLNEFSFTTLTKPYINVYNGAYFYYLFCCLARLCALQIDNLTTESFWWCWRSFLCNF